MDSNKNMHKYLDVSPHWEREILWNRKNLVTNSKKVHRYILTCRKYKGGNFLD